MADIVEAENGRSKKGDQIKRVGVVIVLLAGLGGGGMVTGYFAANGFQAVPSFTEDAGKPELVVREGQSTSMPAAMASQRRAPQTERFKESAYKATYYPIETPFTSNLKGSDNFVQLSVSVATYYDQEVLDHIRNHETAIRSAILMALAEQELGPLGTQQGKRALQKLLTDAVNKVLIEKTGFGGVNDVYFTSFVVQ